MAVPVGTLHPIGRTQSPLSLAISDNDASARESEASRRMQTMNRVELEIWLRKMPKGADLHIHLAGSVYSEALLKIAIKKRLYFDPKTNTLSKQPVDGSVEAKNIPTDSKLLIQFSNAFSIRGCGNNSAHTHDHFMYEVFGPVFSILDQADVLELLEAVSEKAKEQNIRYLELMVGYRSLKSIMPVSKHFATKMNYIVEVSRTQPQPEFKKAVEEAFNLITIWQQVISMNIVGPEDNYIAQTEFKKQIQTVSELWAKKAKPPLTLHGGELTERLSSPEFLNHRIRDTIMGGHCRRVGHAVSLAKESDVLDSKDKEGLLTLMKKKRIAVEACLSSNARLLGVSGEDHPIRTYVKHGVPVVLCSDDPAVNREDLTYQYVRAVVEHDFDYRRIKWFNRNSLEYSFLPGDSIFEAKGEHEFIHLFIGVDEKDWKPSPEQQLFLDSSEKAREQVALERALVEFEFELIK